MVTAIATCGFGLGLGLRLERPRGFKESSGSGGTEENGHQKEREIECGSPQVTRLTSSRGDARSLSHGSARPANIRRCLSTSDTRSYGQNAERTTRKHTPPNQRTATSNLTCVASRRTTCARWTYEHAAPSAMLMKSTYRRNV